MKKLIIAFITILFIFQCCKKAEKDPPYDTDPSSEIMTEQESEAFESLPEIDDMTIDKVILPNGQLAGDFMRAYDREFYNNTARINNTISGNQHYKNELIARLCRVALKLSKISFESEGEGPDMPKQNRIFYSYGSKEWENRHTPPDPSATCSYKIHGLDCSGFIYQLFSACGIDFPKGNANTQRMPSTLNKQLQKSGTHYSELIARDLGSIEKKNFETGDIIYFIRKGETKAFHIGIVFRDPFTGKLGVMQCNGRVGKNSVECAHNLTKTTGLHLMQLVDPIYFGPAIEYGIVRIDAPFAGKWEFHLRCKDKTQDIVVLDLDFPEDKKSFVIQKDFVDYDGSNDHIVFNFTYTPEDHILSCKYTATTKNDPSFIRNDWFSVKLIDDELGYFLSQNINTTNSNSCANEVKLIKK